MEGRNVEHRILERILAGSEDPTNLPLSILESITEGFSEERKIGEGGFGEVYKGVLQNGSVAVKRIVVNNHTIDDSLFYREVTSLLKINHQNLVRFLGFCSNTHHEVSRKRKMVGSEGILFHQIRERLLCFEYISNGSLDKHITDELRGLEWNTRYQIIKGISEGLQYLHEEKQIIHMDLKPANIMVDNDMVPKITDFGLSRPDEKSRTTGVRFGSGRYCAPEYKSDGKTSLKCDIYSLGVIIIELVTGRDGIPNKNNVLRRWRHRWNKSARHTPLQDQQVIKCMEIAESCMKKEPKERPSIWRVIRDLNNEIGSTTDHISAVGQINPSSVDDMLGIEPLELHFAFELNKQISCTVELVNEISNYFAFNIKTLCQPQYCTQPNKGIVPPQSKRTVMITLQAQETTPPYLHHNDEFIVQSKKVKEGLTDEDITEDMFNDETGHGEVIDEVSLTVIYGEPLAGLSVPVSKDINSSSCEDTRGHCEKGLNFHPPHIISAIHVTGITKYKVRDQAVDLVTGAMGSLLPKLRELKEHNDNTKKDVGFIEGHLSMMHAALCEVSQAQRDQLAPRDKVWAKEVRELSYDIEDVVDGLLVRIERSEPVTNQQIAKEIKEIKHQVEQVAKMWDGYKVGNSVANLPATSTADFDPDTRIDPRMAGISEDVASLVGIDGPKQELVDLLTQGEERLIVVSIVGVGGLGKTTLAKSVFEELGDGGQFQSQAFVSVSLKPYVKKILSSILRQVNTKDKCCNAGEKEPDELIMSIRQFLKDKRYLIVIDDVWDESAWKIIKRALVDNNRGSRVIVTTRNVDVGKLSSSPIDGALYKLDPLSDADSKRLFYKRIFEKADGTHIELEEVAGKILKKCGGIPLAIITIASLLASKPKTRSQWDGVYKSIGSGLDKDKPMENMQVILSLSYRDLPSHLKPCLLYLSSFPEDHVIKKDLLLRRWVVEGLVDEKHGKKFYDLYAIGESYFNELVNRSLIQPMDMDDDGSVTSCRVHDMILDLLISLATEENFMFSSDCQQFNPPLCKIRRLSLQDIEEDSRKEQVIVPATGDVSHVRSVIAFGDAFKGMPPLSRFSVLRILDLESRKNHPKDLGSLHHLRYLRLCGRLEKELLEQIGNLSHLKILHLLHAEMEELPASIVNLRELESLLVPSPFVRMPDGIGNLSRLQELGWVPVEPNTVAELGKLTQLRVLHIYNLNKDNDKAFLQSLSNLGNLLALFIAHGCIHRTLSISLDGTSDTWRVPARLQVFNAWGIFCQLPRWFSSLDELSSLTIQVDKLTQDDLEMLGALPVLRFLQLNVAQEEWLVVAVDKPFRSLETFSFACDCDARCWMVFAPGVMSRLQSLEYYRFYAVGWNREGGIGLENLTSLEYVAITVDCRGAGVREVMDVEAVIRGEIDIHPNHPILDLSRRNEDYLMSNDKEKDDDEASEQS